MRAPFNSLNGFVYLICLVSPGVFGGSWLDFFHLLAFILFIDAGFEWREPGCSMCLGMNADQLRPAQRCASTSNRNFEGRQGAGGRTHLVSPQMAAAAAIMGHFVDIREWQ